MTFRATTVIGRLERVPLRAVWPHEERDFTPWLRDNIEVLNKEIDITIADVEREQSAGTFSVDLVGEDESGQRVVIENQFGKSDHDHLGKLITYLTAFEAGSGIWIVEDPRPEHVAAITWLNQSTPASFYLLKVDVCIGDSAPAPILTRIVGPSAESRDVGAQKQEMAERHNTIKHFWATSLERARARSALHANISPSRDPMITAGAGRSGLGFNYIITRNNARVELAMARSNAHENKEIFDRLYAERDDIEQRFGEPLDWLRLEAKKASRVEKTVDHRGYRVDETEWPEIQDTMVDAMIRLEHALRPHIEQLL